MKRALLLFLCFAACAKPAPPSGPRDAAAAAEAFSRALQAGDSGTAWSLLSARTQAQADALAAKARVSADAGPESGKAMLFSSALPLGVAQAREVSTDGGSSTISVAIDGGPAMEFRAVRENGTWKLELDL